MTVRGTLRFKVESLDFAAALRLSKTTLQERLEEEFEEIIVDSHNANQKLSWRHIQLPQSTPQVIIFSAGIGDGSYPSYLGYDMDGNVCRLVSDFKLYRYFE